MTVVLIALLSCAPTYAGHSVAGYGYCECNNPIHINSTSLNAGSTGDSCEGGLDVTEQPEAPDFELTWLLLAVVLFLRAEV